MTKRKKKLYGPKKLKRMYETEIAIRSKKQKLLTDFGKKARTKLTLTVVEEAIETLFDPRRTKQDTERAWKIIRLAEKKYGKKRIDKLFKDIKRQWVD